MKTVLRASVTPKLSATRTRWEKGYAGLPSSVVSTAAQHIMLTLCNGMVTPSFLTIMDSDETLTLL